MAKPYKACHASVLCNGVTQWLLGFNEGWYHDPKLVALLKRQMEIDREALAWDRASVNEVAFIVDDTSQLHQPVANVIPDFVRDSASRWLIYELPPRVGRCGTGVDWILLDDLDQARPYKVYVVLNAFALDERKRSLLKWRVCRQGATVLWMWAPNVIHDRLRPNGIGEITGIRAKMSRESIPTAVRLGDLDHPLLNHTLTGVRTLGDWSRIAPRFWVDDPEAIILGHSDHDGRPALALREFDEWRSIYLASPLTLDERFIREVARFGGAHVYYDGPDATYIGPGLIAMHGQETGRKRIRLPYRSRVRDLYTDSVIADDTTEFEFELERYRTVLFRFDPVGAS